MSSPRSQSPSSLSPLAQARSFGVSVGGVLCVIAAVLVWRGRLGRGEIVGVVGAALLLCGLTMPSVLRVPAALWFRMSRVLGHVNARVILSVLFFLVLTPLGLIWRLTGRDPLARRRAADAGWIPHHARYRDAQHFTRMF